ncbi:MAG TPA: hypothetical protein VEL76_12445 [Gemmataceae bacterium]|nr:hypothetical protein [Gemmataceae bacterium]
MVDPKPDVPPSHDNPAVDHETSDVNVSAIVKFGLWFGGFAVVVHLVVAFTFSRFDARTQRAQPILSPLFKKERPQLPHDLKKIPEPILQLDDVADMGALRRKEDEALNRSGPVDAKGEFVRLPIDRAMTLLIESEKARAAAGLRPRVKKPGGP